jgi:hypothetical protein
MAMILCRACESVYLHENGYCEVCDEFRSPFELIED